jgi:hypothetical protein
MRGKAKILQLSNLLEEINLILEHDLSVNFNLNGDILVAFETLLGLES